MPPFAFGAGPPPPAATGFGSESLFSGGPARSPTTPQPGLFATPFARNGRPAGGLFGAHPHLSPKDPPPTTRDYAKTVAPDAGVAVTESVEFSDVIIKVIVGSGDLRKTFIVHETVLSKRTIDLKENIKANGNGTLELPEVEPEVFNLYLQHLYARRLPSKPDTADLSLNDHVQEIGLLCKFFALAKTMRDSTAAQDAIDAMYAKAHERPPEGHPLLPSSLGVDMIYKATDALCGARKLMVDLHVWKAASAWVKQHIDDGMQYPIEFVNDLAIALLAQKQDLSKTVMLEKEASEYYDSV